MIGLGLECKPVRKASERKVALLALASSSVVVLIRTSKIGLPDHVRDFCSRWFLRYFPASLSTVTEIFGTGSERLG